MCWWMAGSSGRATRGWRLNWKKRATTGSSRKKRSRLKGRFRRPDWLTKVNNGEQVLLRAKTMFFRNLSCLGAIRATMGAMFVAYDQLLDGTIQHLHDLKDRGVRFVSVSSETLASLSQ